MSAHAGRKPNPTHVVTVRYTVEEAVTVRAKTPGQAAVVAELAVKRDPHLGSRCRVITRGTPAVVGVSSVSARL